MSDVVSEPPRSAKPKRGALKIWAGLIVLYIAGIITGIYGVKLLVKNALENVATGGPSEVASLIVSFIDFRAGLTDEQSAKVEKIIKDTQFDLSEIRRPVMPAIQERMVTACREIRAALRPDQQDALGPTCEQFEQRIADREKYLSEFRKGM